MLNDLEVLNGELTPKFDKYNYIYTVSINKDINYLDLLIDNDEDYTVNIIGNENLISGENTVLIEVSNNDEVVTYTLNVNKETTVTNTLITIPQKVEVKQEMPNYVAPAIAIVCFLLILISFMIIFRKKRIKQ